MKYTKKQVIDLLADAFKEGSDFTALVMTEVMTDALPNKSKGYKVFKKAYTEAMNTINSIDAGEIKKIFMEKLRENNIRNEIMGKRSEASIVKADGRDVIKYGKGGK